MSTSVQPAHSPRHRRIRGPRWRPSLMSWLISLVLLLGLGVFFYPSAAQWLSSYNQAKVVERYSANATKNPQKPPAQQLKEAAAYNDALTSGVDLSPGSRKPTAVASTAAGSQFDYDKILDSGPDGIMARLRVPTADVDLPVYHGTSDATLERGAGHLEGSHFPIGGVNQRSVITAHRGLATSTMFTHLDKVKVGHRFTIEVLGKTLTYEVNDVKVIDPSDTESILPVPNRDLVTLITCTPLGVNTHRIVVTGERVTPNPPDSVTVVRSDLPGFPTWAVVLGVGVLGTSGFLWRAGISDARAARRARERAQTTS